jgi:hypothetical protein
MVIGHYRDLGLACPLAGYTSLTCSQRSSGFFLVGMAQNTFPCVLEAHKLRNRCYGPAWGSYAGCRCNTLVLKLHHVLVLFFVALVYESAEPLIC